MSQPGAGWKFLSWHGGYRAFLWRPPKHNRTVRVCAGSGASRITRYSDFSCTMSRW
ncbi:phage tail protein [Escherichia coli]|nr:phage tail protein [Escherichia coli]